MIWPSTPSKTAPAATFRDALLLVQTSLALLAPTKEPACTSISPPDMAKTPAPAPQASVPAPDFFSVPVPVKVLPLE